MKFPIRKSPKISNLIAVIKLNPGTSKVMAFPLLDSNLKNYLEVFLENHD
jgi:hypothetical protein